MYFSIDTALATLKLVSLLLTGFFAVFGLLIEYRDKATGRITTGGKVALVGIILSTTVGLVSQLIEQRKSIEDARASASRTEKLLTEISKSLQPLRQIRVTYFLDIGVEDPDFSSYKARLGSAVKNYIQRHPILNDEAILEGEKIGLRWESMNDERKILTVRILPNSTLLPNEVAEPLVDQSASDSAQKIFPNVSKKKITATAAVVSFEVQGHHYYFHDVRVEMLDDRMHLLTKFPNTAEELAGLQR